MQSQTNDNVALITGASGFIGGRLREVLLEDGVDVVALTRKGSPAPTVGRAREVDYGRPETLEQVLAEERPGYVYHVAGATKGVTYEDFQRGNVMPTRNLLEATKRAHPGLRRVVHISSLTAFGPAGPEGPMQEHHEPNPVEHYGRSKLEAERVVEEHGQGLPWTIVRPAGVYGPGDVDNFELFKLSHRRLNVFFGNRDLSVSLVYVDDVVRAIRAAAQSERAEQRGYFICDGRPRTWESYQQVIVESSGRRALELSLPSVCVDIAAAFVELMTRFDGKPRLFNRQKSIIGKQSWTCRHDRAREDFDYQPRVELEDGVRRTFAWYRSEGWL